MFAKVKDLYYFISKSNEYDLISQKFVFIRSIRICIGFHGRKDSIMRIRIKIGVENAERSDSCKIKRVRSINKLTGNMEGRMGYRPLHIGVVCPVTGWFLLNYLLL